MSLPNTNNIELQPYEYININTINQKLVKLYENDVYIEENLGKIKVDETDLVSGYLSDKLVAGQHIDIHENGLGQLVISSDLELLGETSGVSAIQPTYDNHVATFAGDDINLINQRIGITEERLKGLINKIGEIKTYSNNTTYIPFEDILHPGSLIGHFYIKIGDAFRSAYSSQTNSNRILM